MQVAPSILSADFGRLNEEIDSICQGGCDWVHVDVMDGHFVPNMTMGPVVVDSVAKRATKGLDVHLMVENNSFFVELFAPLNPAFITFHVESEPHAHRMIQKIKSHGIKAGIALNPHTPLSMIEHIAKDLDLILIMSVNPGFGGQSFIEESLPKIEALRQLLKRCGNDKALIEVDGGVSDKNILLLRDAGVDIVVAGSYVFGHPQGISHAIKSLKV